MKRKGSIIFLMLGFIISLAQPSWASQPIFETYTSDEMTTLTQKDKWNTMQAFPRPNLQGQVTGPFEKIEYYVKSTGATGGIRYRTKQITFSVGQFGPTTFSAEGLRSKPPAPGQTVHDKVILDRGFFQAILGSASGPGGPALVDQALDTETVMKVGAVIEIYNASTGQVLMTIDRKDSSYSGNHNTCDDAAKPPLGFGPNDIADMKSRWNDIPLRPYSGPDFKVWIGSKDIGNKLPGEMITIDCSVKNLSGTLEKTDIGVAEYGSGWNPPTVHGPLVDIPIDGNNYNFSFQMPMPTSTKMSASPVV